MNDFKQNIMMNKLSPAEIIRKNRNKDGQPKLPASQKKSYKITVKLATVDYWHSYELHFAFGIWQRVYLWTFYGAELSRSLYSPVNKCSLQLLMHTMVLFSQLYWKIFFLITWCYISKSTIY